MASLLIGLAIWFAVLGLRAARVFAFFLCRAVGAAQTIEKEKE